MAEKHTHDHHHHDYHTANSEHFSERAQTYRSELSIEFAKRSAALILKAYPFDSNKTEVLDFACGPGLVAAELLSHAKRIVGADSAQGMVDVFNHTAEQQGISSDKLHCIKVDSLKGDQSDLNGMLFDVIICALAYHHFDDPNHMTRALAQRLKPKGRLFVIDFMNDEEMERFAKIRYEHAHNNHTVAHKHGFSSEEMLDMFKSADLQNPQIQNAYKMSKSELKSYQGHEVFGKVMNSDIDFTLSFFLAYGDKAPL